MDSHVPCAHGDIYISRVENSICELSEKQNCVGVLNEQIKFGVVACAFLIYQPFNGR